MVIEHNMVAMNANRQLKITGKDKAESARKLSSGYRINIAADDAAGLAISEKMRNQIRGLTQGVANAEEGVSLCQVADGALVEVNDMLHRITELSVQAANGTNSDNDRQMIQDEVDQILTEIDRIGDTTKLNDTYIFRGNGSSIFRMQDLYNADGYVPFEDLALADIDLGLVPFRETSGPQELNLRAIVNNPDSLMNGRTYGLIFGNGSTSSSSIRLSYSYTDTSGTTVTVSNSVVDFNSLSVSGYEEGDDGDGHHYWKRDFTYRNDDGVNITITQRIALDEGNATEKKYIISYGFKNDGIAVDMDFMFHADTAYNNNDRCEGYFVDGRRIDRTKIYSSASSKFTDGITNGYIDNTGIPDSLSIVDMDNALAFSEKVAFYDEDSKPDSFSIGHYSHIDDWTYYDSLGVNLGQNAIGIDLGFSLMWNHHMDANAEWGTKFDYGIISVASDVNLDGNDITTQPIPIIEQTINHPKKIWIQAGNEEGSGLYINLAAMNCKIMGINGLNVSTEDSATKAINVIEKALKYVTGYRANVGATQNRLEHAVANEDNIVENTTASESRIRDTDMADEMVRYSMRNILEQFGQSNLAQANQSTQGVLNLLQ